MPSINRVTLLGHAGQDAETRQSGSGLSITNVSIATTYKPRDGEERTEWHRIVAFGVMADQLATVRKGDLVYIDGRLQTRSYDAKDGTKRYVTEVVADVAVRCEWTKQQRSNDYPF